jgi:hypothetical protein
MNFQGFYWLNTASRRAYLTDGPDLGAAIEWNELKGRTPVDICDLPGWRTPCAPTSLQAS